MAFGTGIIASRKKSDAFKAAEKSIAGQDWAGAREKLELILQIDPNSSDAWSQLSIVYANLNLLNEQVTALQSASKLDPANVEILVRLGQARVAIGQRKAAAASFRAALLVDPESEGGIVGLHQLGLAGDLEYFQNGPAASVNRQVVALIDTLARQDAAIKDQSKSLEALSSTNGKLTDHDTKLARFVEIPSQIERCASKVAEQQEKLTGTTEKLVFIADDIDALKSAVALNADTTASTFEAYQSHIDRLTDAVKLLEETSIKQYVTFRASIELALPNVLTQLDIVAGRGLENERKATSLGQHVERILSHLSTVKAQALEISSQRSQLSKVQQSSTEQLLRLDALNQRITDTAAEVQNQASQHFATKTDLTGVSDALTRLAAKADFEAFQAETHDTFALKGEVTALKDALAIVVAKADLDALEAQARETFASKIEMASLKAEFNNEFQAVLERAELQAVAHGELNRQHSENFATSRSVETLQEMVEGEISSIASLRTDLGLVQKAVAHLDVVGRQAAAKAELFTNMSDELAATKLALQELQQNQAVQTQIADLKAQIGARDAVIDQMLGYLNGRVEFIRREVLYEFHHGGTPGSEFSTIAATPPKIIAVKKVAKMMHTGLRLNLGSGHLPREGFINIDRRELPGVDIACEVDAIPLEAGSVIEISSSHLLEHFPQEELVRRVLPHWRNLMKKGARLHAIVPDGKTMVDQCAKGGYPFTDFREVLFGAQDYQGDFHYNMFTPESIETLLTENGFSGVQILEEGRANGRCFEMEVEAFLV